VYLPQPATSARLDLRLMWRLPTTGDFARLDRGQTSGEQSVMDLFRDASKSSETLGDSNTKAASAALQLASAAARGGGALGSLPSIVQSIITAAQAASASSAAAGCWAGWLACSAAGVRRRVRWTSAPPAARLRRCSGAPAATRAAPTRRSRRHRARQGIRLQRPGRPSHRRRSPRAPAQQGQDRPRERRRSAGLLGRRLCHGPWIGSPANPAERGAVGHGPTDQGR
jgi:hypothetical protein